MKDWVWLFQLVSLLFIVAMASSSLTQGNTSAGFLQLAIALIPFVQLVLYCRSIGKEGNL